MSPAPVFVRIPGSHHPGIRLRLIPGFRDPGSVLILGQVTQYGNPYLICITETCDFDRRGSMLLLLHHSYCPQGKRRGHCDGETWSKFCWWPYNNASIYHLTALSDPYGRWRVSRLCIYMLHIICLLLWGLEQVSIFCCWWLKQHLNYGYE